MRWRTASKVDFAPELHGLTAQEIRRMDRAAQFAVVAAQEAVSDSGLDLAGLDPYRTGVTVGSAVGCTMGLEEEYRVVSDDGRHWLVDHEHAVPHLYGYFVPGSMAAEVAWRVGAEGPAAVVSTGATAGSTRRSTTLLPATPHLQRSRTQEGLAMRRGAPTGRRRPDERSTRNVTTDRPFWLAA
jgi:3-oxoacyl-(acyl-carrier-protein) synthase